MALKRFGLGAHSLVVELASNDGYLLKNFMNSGIPVLGIDPSDTVAAAAARIGVPTLVEFFGAALAEKLALRQQADLIIGNNVLAHVPLLNDFVAGIGLLLKPTGHVTLEFPHVLELIEHVQFDTIYHEHYSYFSLYAIERVFERHGLRIYDVETLPTHGGSLRIFAAHAWRPDIGEGTCLLDVRAREQAAGLSERSTYQRFAQRVDECRTSLRNFLAAAKRASKVVAGYGAAAKGNTLLNFCEVTPEEIPMVADRNPNKQSKLLPGTHIPVVSPQVLMRAKPDYVLILPWNLQSEIRQQLHGIAEWGGRFVTPVPLTRVDS
jgi:SAM-dependent methyltransferase